MKERVARKGLYANFRAAPRLEEVASYRIVVVCFDDQLFCLTHSCTQLERLPTGFGRQGGFADIHIRIMHRLVSHGELRVELRGSLEKRQGSRAIARAHGLNT